MAQNDRWTLKILALPIFTDDFAQAILATPLANLAFVIATDAGSGTAFADQVASWAPSWEEWIGDALFKDPLKLEQFWSLVCSAEKVFLESSVVQLGFGHCEGVEPIHGSSPVSKLRKEAAIKSLLNKPARQPNKRFKKNVDENSSNTPLLDLENAEKAKWASRLEAIGRRAGVAARMFSVPDQPDELSSVESMKLKQLVLASGAPRTMSAHIRAFEKFEMWADCEKIELFPITIEKVLKYALRLDNRECGPSVIPAFRSSLKWVAARLALELPDLQDMRLKALQDKVISMRAKTLKEACPVPMLTVRALERFVVREDQPSAARVFVWWILCMIFASLRFDDAIHVKPHELVWKEQGLYGVAWQTKVDRKRAGTRFIVPDVGFSSEAWLKCGWDLFHLFWDDRDYWIEELNTRNEFLSGHPPTYSRVVQWLKFFCHLAIAMDGTISQENQAALAALSKDLTAHSCRVTMLDAAVHAGRSAQEIGLQANWKDPGPLVLKYTRNRSSVPALMIKELVKDLVREEHPVQEDKDTVLDDAADLELCDTEFFVKKAAGKYYEYKFHATAVGSNDTLACGKFEVAECASVGSVLPDVSVLCKACAKARPDLVCSYSQKSELA